MRSQHLCSLVSVGAAILPVGGLMGKRVGILGMAVAMAMGTLLADNRSRVESVAIGTGLREALKYSYKRAPSSGKPSGAARAKRIARKNRHIRARSAK